MRQIQVQRRPPRRADSEPPRAEYHDPAIRRARQATARAARKTPDPPRFASRGTSIHAAAPVTRARLLTPAYRMKSPL